MRATLSVFMMGSLFAVVATAVISSRDQAMHETLPMQPFPAHRCDRQGYTGSFPVRIHAPLKTVLPAGLIHQLFVMLRCMRPVVLQPGYPPRAAAGMRVQKLDTKRPGSLAAGPVGLRAIPPADRALFLVDALLHARVTLRPCY